MLLRLIVGVSRCLAFCLLIFVGTADEIVANGARTLLGKSLVQVSAAGVIRVALNGQVEAGVIEHDPGELRQRLTRLRAEIRLTNVEQHVKKNLVMFVTAKIVTPAGLPLNEEEEEGLLPPELPEERPSPAGVRARLGQGGG